MTRGNAVAVVATAAAGERSKARGTAGVADGTRERRAPAMTVGVV